MDRFDAIAAPHLDEDLRPAGSGARRRGLTRGWRDGRDYCPPPPCPAGWPSRSSLFSAAACPSLALSLAEDAAASGGAGRRLSVAATGRGWLAGADRGLRRRARTGLARHRDAALPVVSSLTTSTGVLMLPFTRPGRADLEPPAAIDVALVVTVDDDVVGLDRAADASLRADDQRSLAFDFALCLALDPQVAVADVLAVEAGVRVDDVFIAPIVSSVLVLVTVPR